MSQIDSLCHALLLLTSNPDVQNLTHFLEATVKSLWTHSYVHVWNKLIQKPQGSVLATASCLPFWENLNFLASRPCPLNCETRAFFLLALTSLYPKYKDKRCFFQHSLDSELDVRALPLTTTLNCLLPFNSPCINDNSSLSIIKDLMSVCDDVSFSSLDTENKKTFLKNIDSVCLALPSWTINLMSENPTISDGTSTVTLLFFQFAVWKILLFCEVHKLSEHKKLIAVLTESLWSKTVAVSQWSVQTIYKSLFEKLLPCISFLRLVGAPKIDLPINNLPMLDFRLINSLILHPSLGSIPKSYLTWSKKCRLRGTSFVCQRKRSALKLTTRYSKIKDDLEMFQSSSTCRNCDEMTVLCRDMVFRYSKSAYKAPSFLSDSKIYSQILFKRKCKNVVHFPSLLPENKPSFMMEENIEENNTNLLESIFRSSM